MDSFDFEPGGQPPASEETDGWWYLFRGKKLVVFAGDEGFMPLFAANPSTSGLATPITGLPVN